MFDTHLLQNGGEEVGDRDGLGWLLFPARRIGAAQDSTRRQTSAPDQATETTWPVVTSFERIDRRCAAEFSQDQDNRGIQQVVLLQVLDECGQGRVEYPGLLPVTLEVIRVRVPSWKRDLDGADSLSRSIRKAFSCVEFSIARARVTVSWC